MFVNTLCLFCVVILPSCSKSCRQWELQEIKTRTCAFNGNRLLLAPDSDRSNLELEIIQTECGIRFYINLLFLQAPFSEEDPTKTQLIIQFENQEPWVVSPHLLEGGQRLLLPGDIADVLINSLLDEHTFKIQLGRNEITVVPTNFQKISNSLF